MDSFPPVRRPSRVEPLLSRLAGFVPVVYLIVLALGVVLLYNLGHDLHRAIVEFDHAFYPVPAEPTP